MPSIIIRVEEHKFAWKFPCGKVIHIDTGDLYTLEGGLKYRQRRWLSGEECGLSVMVVTNGRYDVWNPSKSNYDSTPCDPSLGYVVYNDRAWEYRMPATEIDPLLENIKVVFSANIQHVPISQDTKNGGCDADWKEKIDKKRDAIFREICT